MGCLRNHPEIILQTVSLMLLDMPGLHWCSKSRIFEKITVNDDFQ